VTGKRETLHPFLKSIEGRTLGTADPSASPLCLGRSWNISSEKLCQGICRTGRWFETASMASTRASPA